MASMKVAPPPLWAIASIGANVALVVVFGTAAWRMIGRSATGSSSQASVSAPHLTSTGAVHAVASESVGFDLDEDEQIASDQLGPRHQLGYSDWVNILTREAEAIVQDPPPSLSILMGDSISLWFPHEQLPPEMTWLNQGISGEVSEGLLNRLDIIAETQPDYIFVMIGINDLLRDVSDRQLLDNQQQIIRELSQMHPSTTIVLQSILPHSAENATWEGKERLMAISNDRIRALNQDLAAIATAENVQFLDLAPLFSDRQGNLPMELSTDGLHLNGEGYAIWSNALQVYQQAIAFDRENGEE
ncbi:MAG: GDSL-type esterase/lipase family protein [Leptolyngbyaceae bacterium]|nr:GDSL-type esterase/lipase family protein [Leptolyngbyaceae bacterium]